MREYFDKAHYGEVSDMSDRLGVGCCSHSIATPEAEMCLWVLLFQGTHEICSMQISRGFSCYDVIFQVGLSEGYKVIVQDIDHEEDEGDKEYDDKSACNGKLLTTTGIVHQ